MVDIRKYMNLMESINKDPVAKFYEYYMDGFVDQIGPDGGLTITTGGSTASVKLFGKHSKISQLPDLKIDKVIGKFLIEWAPLVSLINSPKHVTDDYVIWNTKSLTSLEGLPEIVGEHLRITWSPNLPLLRLLKCQVRAIQIYENDKVWNILNSYINKSSRRDIIELQKELIDNGFEGNAKW